MADTGEVTVPEGFKATRYELDALTPDDPSYGTWHLSVEWRGVGRDGVDRWAVLRGSFCLDAEGRREWESSPSNRSDELVQRFRFDLSEALRIAVEALPRLVVNGRTAADWAQFTAARDRELREVLGD